MQQEATGKVPWHRVKLSSFKRFAPMDRACSSPAQTASADAVVHHQPGQNPQTGMIIAKIEEVLGDNIDALRDGRVLTIPLHNRRTGRLQVVRFPSSRDSEARKFSRSITRCRSPIFFPLALAYARLFFHASSCPASNTSFVP